MATSCPECGGSGKVHVAKYDRTKIPTHEHIHSGSGADGDTWLRAQGVATPKATACRVCYGKGSI